jgi:hypothetical protein
MEAFRLHRSLHPQQTHDHKGQPIFDVHPAKPLLQEDVRMKRHLEMSPMVLKTTRREYGDFDLQTFRQHIYQEVRRQKFIYFLNVKRAEKLKQHTSQAAINNPVQPIVKLGNKSSKHKKRENPRSKDSLLPCKRTTKVVDKKNGST